MLPPIPDAYATVTPALQQVLRLLPASPYAAVLELPRATAERAARRALERYPSATAHRNVQSALRSQGLPSVRAVLMPPDLDAVALLLLANVPPDDREDWRHAADPLRPLTWRGYEVASVAALQGEADRLRKPRPRRATDAERHTWRLSRQAREDFRQQITRIIHSTKPGPDARRSGGPLPGRTRTPAGQRAALESLGRHLGSFPGLNGINTDRWLLQQHMLRLWKQQHPKEPPPEWPRFPWSQPLPAKLAPLADLWPDPINHAQEIEP